MHVTSATHLVPMSYFGWQTLSTRDPQSICKVNLFGGLTGYSLSLQTSTRVQTYTQSNLVNKFSLMWKTGFCHSDFHLSKCASSFKTFLNVQENELWLYHSISNQQNVRKHYVDCFHDSSYTVPGLSMFLDSSTMHNRKF